MDLDQWRAVSSSTVVWTLKLWTRQAGLQTCSRLNSETLKQASRSAALQESGAAAAPCGLARILPWPPAERPKPPAIHRSSCPPQPPIARKLPASRARGLPAPVPACARRHREARAEPSPLRIEKREFCLPCRQTGLIFTSLQQCP